MTEGETTPTDHLILVADIGGTTVKIGFAQGRRPLDYVRLFPTAGLRDGDPIAALAAMVDAAIAESRLRPSLVVATVPGFLDVDEDRVLSAGNIPQLNGRRLAGELGRALDIPVILERDAVLLLIGETIAGAGRGAGAALGLFFGTGVGAAFTQDGRPFRGAGWALEIGHMPFKGDGRRQAGMRTDSLEAYVSGSALEAIASAHGVPIESVFVADAGNLALASVLATFVKDMAFAVGTAVALLSPAVVILGGGLCAMRGFPREKLSALVEANAPFAETGRAMDLRWAELGWRSVLHGAAHAAAEHAARHPRPADSPSRPRRAEPSRSS